MLPDRCLLKSSTALALSLSLASLSRAPRHGRRGHEPSSPPTPRTTCGHEQSHHHRRPNLELSQCLGPFFSFLFRFIFFLTVGGFRFTLSGFPASTSTRHCLCSLWRLPVAPLLRLSFGCAGSGVRPLLPR
ncbi:uncharacterized protein LOC120650380 [Panicum virgatum]|uniref:uncharacterized protein LOC120650380 n=1 Tax=Panicum virgatum TaxID=38727 RepID=UPI0019D6784E|nr:uncharacterized protein LOC120650380 [Panicum virgatum]